MYPLLPCATLDTRRSVCGVHTEVERDFRQQEMPLGTCLGRLSAEGGFPRPFLACGTQGADSSIHRHPECTERGGVALTLFQVGFSASMDFFRPHMVSLSDCNTALPVCLSAWGDFPRRRSCMYTWEAVDCFHFFTGRLASASRLETCVG